MIQLYFEKKWTVKQLVAHYKIPKRTIYSVFSRYKVELRGDKSKRKLKTLEREILLKLYENEKLSIEEVASQLKVSYPIVSRELKRHGIKIRSRKEKPKKNRKTLDRGILVELYENEKLSIGKVASRLKVSHPTVRKELKRHEIRIRANGELSRKYPELSEMVIGEQLVIKRPQRKQPHVGLYLKAKRAGIRVSVKRIDEDTMSVTRIE